MAMNDERENAATSSEDEQAHDDLQECIEEC